MSEVAQSQSMFESLHGVVESAKLSIRLIGRWPSKRAEAMRAAAQPTHADAGSQEGVEQ